LLWWADKDLPRDGQLKWGGSELHFESLRDAINFVFAELSQAELSTALILFDAAPYSLNFSKIGEREKAVSWLREKA
jgi:hypothetical protein